MDHRTMRRRVAGVASTTAVLLAMAIPAAAHVDIVDAGAVVGGGHGTQITFRVPHGCQGAATDTVEIKIPEGVTGVQPKLMPGWTIETETVDVVEASAAPGASPAGHSDDEPQVTLVRWSGGSLPDAFYADFQLRAVFPETPGTVAFPTIQRCGDAEVAWIEVAVDGQSEDDLELPAPTVTIVAAGDKADQH